MFRYLSILKGSISCSKDTPSQAIQIFGKADRDTETDADTDTGTSERRNENENAKRNRKKKKERETDSIFRADFKVFKQVTLARFNL